MIKKDTVLYWAKTKEDSIFLSAIFDNYIKAVTSSVILFSGFMSERKQAMVREAFSSEKSINLNFFGGFEAAERKILCFSNEEDITYPIKVIKADIKGKASLSHRDFLGALMSLGIKRDVIGDIITGEENLIFVKEEMADYIITNLGKAKNSNLSLSEYDGDNFPKLNEGKDYFETVASLRLDAVVSCGLNLSREKSKKLIESGRVCVNSFPVESVDFSLSEGDVISAKGFGRFTLKEIKGLSKKGRIILNINKV